MGRNIEMTAILDPGADDAEVRFESKSACISLLGQNMTLSFHQLDALIDEYRRYQRLQAMIARPIGVEDLPALRSAAE